MGIMIRLLRRIGIVRTKGNSIFCIGSRGNTITQSVNIDGESVKTTIKREDKGPSRDIELNLSTRTSVVNIMNDVVYVDGKAIGRDIPVINIIVERGQTLDIENSVINKIEFRGNVNTKDAIHTCGSINISGHLKCDCIYATNGNVTVLKAENIEQIKNVNGFVEIHDMSGVLGDVRTQNGNIKISRGVDRI